MSGRRFGGIRRYLQRFSVRAIPGAIVLGLRERNPGYETFASTGSPVVMELVEGETLQARIRRGALPVDEALAIANQIAVALEAAHRKGITVI